ncbi:MAG: nicotinate mononucleotide-dependent phosphoribosyltransferase CobT [Promethearchaeota archaeon]
MESIIKIGKPSKVENFLERVRNKKPLFIVVLGNTETAKIPGISAAGANPALTDYTPAADVEYLFHGACKSIEGVPITPNGIPTPALITKACLELSDIPLLVAIGGVRIYPQTPYLEFGGKPGHDISKGNAVESIESALKNAKLFGENISKIADYLVIGESIAGGTTTALGVLMAMGYDASDKISSSLPMNPIDLKKKVVNSGLKSIGITAGQFRENPLNAIKHLGDPMQPVHAGIVMGAAKKIPVLLAGGTQMAAIIVIIKALEPSILENIAIGTTRWIVQDSQTDLKGIIDQIAPDLPIFAANLDFSAMKYDGLKAYERGIVKEGVGAGGITLATLLSHEKTMDMETILSKIEENYAKLRSK